MSSQPEKPFDGLKRLFGNLPTWVSWAMAVFGVCAVVVLAAYAYYLKRKGAQA